MPYRKHQRLSKYHRLKEAYDLKYEKAAADYLEKAVRSLKEDDPGRAYRCLKKMAAQPGDYLDEGSFTLLSHSEDNLSPEQSIEKIAQHFSKISQEFQPLNYDLCAVVVPQFCIDILILCSVDKCTCRGISSRFSSRISYIYPIY